MVMGKVTIFQHCKEAHLMTLERDGEYLQSGAFAFIPALSYTADPFYFYETMTSYPSSNRVYIIKHADGNHYSKIQVTYEYLQNPARDTFTIKYKNLN
jgi:triacylglycerol esterase/lipase EstA (alpha/beta hydrolase family)